MNITGKIKKLTHNPLLQKPLKKIEFNDFDINDIPSSCIINDGNYSYAISKWISPKRTRSYPYERVYSTLNISKKITVIPVMKDEGKRGERDFIQWDTVSLMSLLDVYVILAYYSDAEVSSKAVGKITNQKFDNQFIKSKIKEIETFHSSALHWNLHELEKKNLAPILDKIKLSYKRIEQNTGIQLHGFDGIERFEKQIQTDISVFRKFSRDKAAKAQQCEFVTLQPKESLSTATKAKITITNYLGGEYFLTVDEVEIDKLKEKVYLIEGKHSCKDKLPKPNDIKHGLLQIAIFSNLHEIYVNNIPMEYEAILCLTSPHIKCEISSNDTNENIREFINKNNFSNSQITLINTLIEGARENKFTILIKYSK